MKKVLFTTMSIIAAAAMMMVSCKKDDPKDNGKDNGGEQQEQKVDDELVGTWTITGEAQGWAADGGVAMTESKNVWTAAEVAVKGEGFKFVKDGAWTINLGASPKTGSTQKFDDDVEFDLEKDGDNIAGVKDGIYSVTLNLLTKKAKIKFVSELPKEGQDWDYVMNISSYKTNSEFHFYTKTTPAPLSINPKAMTFEWKFYATEWNDYDQTIERDGETYKVWANRLGQICDRDEKGLLFRFNDGGQKGQLRFNSDVLGTDDNSKQYVAKDGKAYIWSLNEWHVLTVTADGTNVTMYDNGNLIYSFAQNTPVTFEEWDIDRFDISMTWDDGTRYDKGQAFRGYIAYTRLWDRVLTAEEIAANLCDVADNNGLKICWNWNVDEGSTIANAGSVSGYDLDFATALAGGQKSYVSVEDIAGTWTDVTEVDGLAPVCPVAE